MSEQIVAGWLLLCLVMLAQRRRRAEQLAARAPGTWVGIVVQALGFSAVWSLRRASGSLRPGLDSLLCGASQALGVAGIVVGALALWALGRQWSVEGRVLAGHELVTSGPYAWVRHPIYTAMFAMLLATALSVSSLPGGAAGCLLFLLGTAVRTRFEERLLRERFGESFEEYRTGVPAFIPGQAALTRVVARRARAGRNRPAADPGPAEPPDRRVTDGAGAPTTRNEE